MYVLWMNPFAVYLKPSRHCQSAILQSKIEKLKKIKNTKNWSEHWYCSSLLTYSAWRRKLRLWGSLKLKKQSWKIRWHKNTDNRTKYQRREGYTDKKRIGSLSRMQPNTRETLMYLCHTCKENTQSQGKSQKCFRGERYLVPTMLHNQAENITVYGALGNTLRSVLL